MNHLGAVERRSRSDRADEQRDQGESDHAAACPGAKQDDCDGDRRERSGDGRERGRWASEERESGEDNRVDH
jgi:hypothetical protein